MHSFRYCEILYFRGLQFSWFSKKLQVRRFVISWIWLCVLIQIETLIRCIHHFNRIKLTIWTICAFRVLIPKSSKIIKMLYERHRNVIWLFPCLMSFLYSIHSHQLQTSKVLNFLWLLATEWEVCKPSMIYIYNFPVCWKLSIYRNNNNCSFYCPRFGWCLHNNDWQPPCLLVNNYY